MSSDQNILKKYELRLEKVLDRYLIDSTPELPSKWKSVIVEYLPWIILITILILLPITFASFLFSSAGSIIFSNIVGVFQTSVNVILGVPIILLYAYSIPGLLKRNKNTGWTPLFYANFLVIVFNLLTLNIYGFAGAILTFYILFQIKSEYS